MRGPSERAVVRGALGCLLGAVLVVSALTSGTLSSFATARLRNDTDRAASSLLAISHAYGSASCAATQAAVNPLTSCPASVYPASVTSSAATATDTVTNTGTTPAAGLSATYAVASCGALDLANSVPGAPSGPMLPRAGTTFAPTGGPTSAFGAVTLDGSSGYAASVAATTEPATTILGVGGNFGLGIWFRTGAAAVQPLFGFGSSPVNAAATDDRILYLDAGGHIGFIARSTLTLGGTMSTASYNDNTWHFAYVAITAGAVSYSFKVYVDNTAVASSGLVLSALTGYSGYWHLGWSPVGGASSYFRGSLSDFTVDDSGAAPTAPGSNPTSPTAFDAANRTELWTLGDSGGSYDGTSTGGTLPAATTLPNSAPNPCAAVTVTWTVAGTTIANGVALSSTPSGTVATGPPPGGAQTSTITLSHAASINSYLPGLLLYAPVTATYTAGASSSWTLPFAWNAPDAASAAGSTFVVQ